MLGSLLYSQRVLVRAIALCPLAAILALSAQAQSAAPAVRIASPIDESQLVTLRGSLKPAAVGAIDRGSVSADLPMVLTLVLSRSAEEQAAFDAFVAGQYDQNSPNFHQWLSPQQIGARFGPAQADISTLSSWLAGHGFAVKTVGADGMTIEFSGTAGQVESAFHTQIHNLSVQGKAHIANITDPQIPAALAPLVAGIKGLHNFLPHPLHRLGSKVEFNPNAHGWVKLETSSGAGFTAGGLKARTPAASVNSTSSTKPNFYIPNYNLGVEEDVGPYDFAKIYNLPSTWPTSGNGAGQTITIVGTSDIELGDVSSFKSAFGLPAGLTPVIAHGPDGDPGVCTGGTNACNGDDLDENSLDVEWSGAVAAGAQIVLVTDAYNSQSNPTNDPVFDGAQWAIDNAYVQGSPVYGSRILSSSYGECELFNGTASNVAYNNLWQTAASGGIAVFVAAGDSGSAGCDQGGDYIGNPYVAQYGLSVSAMASSPYDTAVGGTDFSWCNPTLASNGTTVNGCTASNASTYWNTSNSSQQASAKGYVPETPWNDTCENPINATLLGSIATLEGVSGVSTPEQACNYVYNPTYGSLYLYFEEDGPSIMQYADTVGGSGGASNCVVNTSTSTTLGSCSSTDTSTGSSYGNLTLVNDGWPKPSWQTAAASLGVPADGVRDLPDVSFFSGDGTLDSASLICVSNDGATCNNISETGSSNPSDTGGAEEIGGTSVATPAMAGVMALINQKIGAPQGSPNAELYTLAGKQTYSGCNAESANCNFQNINQGTNAMPCAPKEGVVEGGATYNYSTGEWVETPQLYALTSPNCTVIDSGDTVGTLSGYGAVTGYNQATGLGSLNVANVLTNWTAATAGTVQVGIGLSGSTFSESASIPVTVTVSGSGTSPITPTGDVTLSASANGYSSMQALSSGTATFTIPAATFTSAGSVTLTADYSGDNNYAPSSNSTTIAIAAPTTGTFALGSITAPAGIAPGATATATATISSSSGYAGTITLNCLLTNEPSGAVNLPSCSPSGTITLSAAATSGTASISVITTAATVESSSLTPASRKGMFGAGGGAVLALLVFFGIPARRRKWRAMLGMFVLLVTLGSLTACGGGSGSTTTIPGTTAGTYTFTVAPAGSPAPASTPSSQTFTVTVSGVGVG